MLNLKIQKLTNVKLPEADYYMTKAKFFLPYDLSYIIQNGKNINIEAYPVIENDNKIVKTCLSIYPCESADIPLGVKVQIPDNYQLAFIFDNTSSQNFSYLFDKELKINYYNNTNQVMHLFPGDELPNAFLLPIYDFKITEIK